MICAQDNDELLHHLLKTLANEHYKYILYNDPEVRRRDNRRRTLGGVDESDDLTRVKIEFEVDEFEVRVSFKKGCRHEYCLVRPGK